MHWFVDVVSKSSINPHLFNRLYAALPRKFDIEMLPVLITLISMYDDTPEPSSAVAVILAVPGFTLVTRPSEFTVATFVLEEDYLIFLLVAFDGETYAFTSVV